MAEESHVASPQLINFAETKQLGDTVYTRAMFAVCIMFSVVACMFYVPCVIVLYFSREPYYEIHTLELST